MAGGGLMNDSAFEEMLKQTAQGGSTLTVFPIFAFESSAFIAFGMLKRCSFGTC